MPNVTYTVTTQQELYTALAKSTGGETILLAAGDYGDIKMGPSSGFDVTFDSEVTIKSANVEDPASFSLLDMRNASNITIDSVVFDYTFAAGDKGYTRDFVVRDSTGISIKNSVFDGDIAVDTSEHEDGVGTSIALSVSNSTDIVVENNEFFDFHRGAVFHTVDDLNVSGNDLHDISSDGLNFIASQGILIEDNSFRDFHMPESSAAHMDMIQFWTSGTDRPSTDIVIRGNAFDMGDGLAAQSIFMRNEAVDVYGAGSEMYYSNILIEENVIHNGHSHGITVGETDGLVIRNNTVLSVDPETPSFFSAPRITISERSENVQVLDNLARDVWGYEGQNSWSVSGNITVQNEDMGAENHYVDLFLESAYATDTPQFIALPGSTIDLAGAGAGVTRLDPTPAEITPHFDVESASDGKSLVFDASYTNGPDGPVTEADGANFYWTFADGAMAEGRVVQHSFDTPGIHDVKLVVEKDGEIYSTQDVMVAVAGEEVLAFNVDTGDLEIKGFGESRALAEMDEVTGSAGNKAIDLGKPGTSYDIEKTELLNFFGSESFDLSTTIRADQPGQSWGEIMRLHGTFTMSVAQDGALVFNFTTDIGEQITLSSGRFDVNTGPDHKIDIAFDGDTGRLELRVDGTLLDAANGIQGTVPNMAHWGLAIGNPWNNQNFDGKMTALTLDAPTSVYAEYDGAIEPAHSQAGTIVMPWEQENPLPGDGEESGSDDSVEEDVLFPETESEAGSGLQHIYKTAAVQSLDLGATGVQHSVTRTELDEYFGSEAFEMSMTLQADQPGESWGEVVRLHGTFVLEVMQDGDLKLRFFDEKSVMTQLTTDNLALNDGAAHDISLHFDGASGSLAVHVDGAVAAQADITATQVPQKAYWDMEFGNRWGDQNFDGQLTEFELNAGTISAPDEEAEEEIVYPDRNEEIEVVHIHAYLEELLISFQRSSSLSEAPSPEAQDDMSVMEAIEASWTQPDTYDDTSFL